ncbi:MAG: T9SS type A sorting domain-containing protein [Flavobacteriales bacterium]|nr:T9SS type A sorting domain-containing protein [Flavobacteriales bacterium]
MKTVAQLFILTFMAVPAFSQDFEEIVKVVADDRETEDRAAWSVDISGDFAIMGAYGDDYGASPNMGSAYLYQRDGLDWVQIQKLSNSDQESYDRFGWSVAIDGDYAIVGAYGEDEDEDGANSLSKAGSAYIFERDEDGVWVEVQKIVAADRHAGDEFGSSVAIHGNTAVVGAHIDDTDEDGLNWMYHSGSAYIFERGADGVWTQTQKIVASDRSPGTEFDPDHEDWNDRFGESVGVWNDFIVVGAPFASKAYMFEKVGGVWTEVSFLTTAETYWLDRYGQDVDIDSTTVMVGAYTEDENSALLDYMKNAGAVYVFNRVAPGTWNYTQKITPADRSVGDHFGLSVSIDGDYMISGTHQDNHDENTENDLENAGSAYIYERTGGVWFEIQKLDASDREIEDQFGIAVSISGNTAIVGAYQQDYTPEGTDYQEDAGAAYIFTNETCPAVSSSQDVVLCVGESVTVGESTYDAAGIYTDILLSAAGCDSTVTTTVSFEAPIETGVSIAGITLTAELDGASYQWIDCHDNSPISGATDQSYTPTANGEYAVIVTDGDCSDTSSCTAITTVGLTSNSLQNQVSIYPNPNKGEFILKSNAGMIGAQLEILNDLGKVIYTQSISQSQEVISLSDLAGGVYMLRLATDEGLVIKKVIVE